MNIAWNLEKSAFHFPDRVAVFEGERQITYTDFNHASSKIAAALVNAGVQPGDHVALCAPNSYHWLAFYFGVLKAGAVAVTFSYLLTKAELSQILADCRPKILFGVDEKLGDFADAKENGKLKLVICDRGDVSYARFIEKGSQNFQTVNRNRKDTAAILYTGGTTGTPKGAMLSHGNLQCSVFNVAHYERSNQNDRALCFLPLNHVFAQVHITHSMVLCGGGLVIQPAFDIEKVLTAIQQYQVTNFYAVPTIYIRLLELDGLREKLKSIRYCFSAAASMATEVVKEWKNQTGLNIHESYGMTESAAMVTYNHYYRHVVGSVGTPVNLIEVQIRDFEGNVLEQGARGEICICGPNITKGYLNKPEETQNAFWGDWFRSGDIGLFDENGYLYIVDRLKDMIVTGGENVYSTEVENVLYMHPKVLEAAVFSVPDEKWGEAVSAAVVLKEDASATEMEIIQFCKQHQASYKAPKSIVFLDELPKTGSGKIYKKALRDPHWK